MEIEHVCKQGMENLTVADPEKNSWEGVWFEHCLTPNPYESRFGECNDLFIDFFVMSLTLS